MQLGFLASGPEFCCSQDFPGCKGKQTSAVNSSVYIKVSKIFFFPLNGLCFALDLSLGLPLGECLERKTRNRTLGY